ncbi:MAG: HAD family phosphatase [Streptococcaceae bacterium]|jgi:HAD superfamily hydrolase (TIGR01509 family)|nr:HAD family phosphatase [Streptococcaceae bacterium]
MDFDAVIFDMDGVLVDSEPFYEARRCDFFEALGISIAHLPHDFFVGGSLKQLWEVVLGEDFVKFDKEEIAVFQARYEAYKDAHPLPYGDLLFPDAKETLETLKKASLKLGLASSSRIQDIARCLRECGLSGFFDSVLSGVDFPETKPNPAIYNKSLENVSVKSDRALIIEDSPKGIAAGKAAGATVWAVKSDNYPLNQSQADLVLPNLTAITQKLSLSDASKMC